MLQVPLWGDRGALLGCFERPAGILGVPVWEPHGGPTWSGHPFGVLRVPLGDVWGAWVIREPFWGALSAQLGSLGLPYGILQVPVLSGLLGAPIQGAHLIEVPIWGAPAAHLGSFGCPFGMPGVPT